MLSSSDHHNSSSTTTNQPTKKKQKITLHLTGFGPFSGVKENPTTLIIEKLKNENFTLQSHDNYEINPIHYSIIETSMKAVKQYFEEMKCHAVQNQQDDESIDIFIHLGVSGNSIMYELEERAKNEKTFRAKDEQGEQPLNEPINEHLPQDTFLHCNFSTKLSSIIESVNRKLQLNSQLHPPLSQFVLETANHKLEKTQIVKSTKNALSSNQLEALKQLEELHNDLQESLSLITQSGAYCKASKDAGLFICNYCYYNSLQYSCSQNVVDIGEGMKRTCYSLFVHVPPHDLIPVHDQAQFVKTLLHTIVEHVVVSE
ncbi:hypothetical protein C9374_011193 [Naegleria lovaniensis]|uniref:Pyroglutamyl-peptidase I n=1 Tax=Naegleria lovaniensis TaxID=51637 RepID=A0AA88GGE7_NAELO|nr:uncharacterized protein C9374_011193 [Naegleria lovaniensis]KAG2374114.1 hypothetical protein C9374_011193 [Naegleria lovaniensis]